MGKFQSLALRRLQQVSYYALLFLQYENYRAVGGMVEVKGRMMIRIPMSGYYIPVNGHQESYTT
ncbi:uncharacterized protein RSE6_13769 [Rhynchosporium secalis]|uniref:Uncharacterized protein n=1 Tax=Rhynchosporium secalis TaxID=38038 RepID=A0A1E1MTM2_RHYSE|nr:uncharacterized protein RSE6_13769 [Rhynchosporium secalis]